MWASAPFLPPSCHLGPEPAHSGLRTHCYCCLEPEGLCDARADATVSPTSGEGARGEICMQSLPRLLRLLGCCNFIGFFFAKGAVSKEGAFGVIKS